MREVVIRSLVILSLLLSTACVVGDVERRITPKDTAWIEKGRTTREQVLAKFGEPTFTETYKEMGQYAEYAAPPTERLSLEPIPSGPFPQVQRPPGGTVSEPRSLGDRFWILYDAQGIVESFGFGPRSRT